MINETESQMNQQGAINMQDQLTKTKMTNETQTMTSIEIAQLTGKQHKNVMADIRKMLNELGNLAAEFSATRLDDRGKEQSCFALDRYHTEVLVTGYDVKRRAAVIERWYDLEAGNATPWHEQQNQPQLPDFTNPAEAARAWADKHDQYQIEHQKRVETDQQLAEAQPKIQFYDEVTEDQSDFSMAEGAKMLGAGRNTFMAALRDIGWLIKANNENEPSSYAIRQGYVTYKISQFRIGSKWCESMTPRITGKGMARLHEMLAEEPEF